ncbi:MAG TPA: A/G-specific adenine glycosylase [Pirellulales bacterium]|nr:A/G-specific adenine glycosylase [Pirellulales bacterium]
MPAAREKIAAKHRLPSSGWLHRARRRLLKWYRHNARDLPWRRTTDPYAIWVSEIMLQQTQVATVERYYAKFMAALPTVAALASAQEDQVLRLWEGLGYYRRARQMHAAAKIIMAKHGGAFPNDLQTLRQLPGIGRYTAGAILSIAFDISAPILEANTVRLLCRLLAYRGDVSGRAGQQLLWQAAEDFLTKRGSGELNQALMELGSLVCTPRNPKCGECPLRELCPTQHGGWQNQIPAPRPQPEVINVSEAAVIIFRRGKILLRKCGPAERWSGLWDFPRFPMKQLTNKPRKQKNTIKKPSRHAGMVTPQRKIEIIERVRQMTGVIIFDAKHFATLRHSVTRFRITLDCFVAHSRKTGRLRNLAPSTNGHSEMRWIEPSSLDDYPLCVTGRRLARLWGEMIDSIS